MSARLQSRGELGGPEPNEFGGPKEAYSQGVMLCGALSLLLAASTGLRVPLLGGGKAQVFPSDAAKGVVVFYVITGCPNAQAYVPEMNRIAKVYGPKGWRFYLDNTDLSPDPKRMRKDARQFGYAFPTLYGSAQLVKLGRATNSPEAAVFSPAGALLYHGRIDDRFYALGKARLAARTHDLRDALDEIDEGEAVKHPVTPVVGCILPSG